MYELMEKIVSKYDGNKLYKGVRGWIKWINASNVYYIKIFLKKSVLIVS